MSVINLPNQGLGYDYRQCPNAPIPGALGGYEYLGVQYLFLLQGSEFGVGDFNLHALKSTDLGVTWTDTGSVSIPNHAGTGQALPVYTSCLDGSFVYVMGIDIDGTGLTSGDATAGPILLYKYNLTTNTFATGVTPGGAPIVYKGWNGATYPPRSGMCLHLLRRGSGDMLLLYTGIETISSNKFTRIYVATFNGTSFGSGVVLAGQAGATVPYIERCACIDGSGNLHVILSQSDFHFWYHIAMDSGGSFGTFQTIETNAWFFNDTSNLISFPGPSDTLAFLGVRNRSSSGDNGDLAIYSAAGGSLSPTWSFHNLPSTANVVQDPRIAPDWIGGLGYLDGTIYAFWTQTGVPHSWNLGSGLGEIRSSTAVATDLTTWTAEVSVMGPFDSGGAHWGASQVGVWHGPVIGLGVLGNFDGFDSGGTGDPIEMSKLLVYPPAPSSGLAIDCGSPPSGTVGVPYSHDFPATGGTPPYVFTITSGSVPPLLIVTGSGHMSGVPTLAGDFPLTIMVTDSTGATATVNCTIHIDMTLSCNNPPSGSAGIPYTHTLVPAGGTPPYTYTVASGSLPPGLFLNSSTGVISGTPS